MYMLPRVDIRELMRLFWGVRYTRKVRMRHSSRAEGNQRPHDLIVTCLTMLSVTSWNWKDGAGSGRVPVRSPELAEAAKDTKPRLEPGNYRIWRTDVITNCSPYKPPSFTYAAHCDESSWRNMCPRCYRLWSANDKLKPGNEIDNDKINL